MRAFANQSSSISEISPLLGMGGGEEGRESERSSGREETLTIGHNAADVRSLGEEGPVGGFAGDGGGRRQYWKSEGISEERGPDSSGGGPGMQRYYDTNAAALPVALAGWGKGGRGEGGWLEVRITIRPHVPRVRVRRDPATRRAGTRRGRLTGGRIDSAPTTDRMTNNAVADHCNWSPAGPPSFAFVRSFSA